MDDTPQTAVYQNKEKQKALMRTEKGNGIKYQRQK